MVLVSVSQYNNNKLHGNGGNLLKLNCNFNDCLQRDRKQRIIWAIFNQEEKMKQINYMETIILIKRLNKALTSNKENVYV